MSTKAETKKSKPINLRITEEMDTWLKKLKINVSDTCRKALQAEIDRLKRRTK